LSELDEESPKRLTISGAALVESELLLDELDDSKLLSNDDVRALLMLLMLDMSFLLPCGCPRTVRGSRRLPNPQSIFFRRKKIPL